MTNNSQKPVAACSGIYRASGNPAATVCDRCGDFSDSEAGLTCGRVDEETVANWRGRGVKRDEHGYPYVGTSRAGVEWYFRAPTFTQVGFRQMCDRFDERECFVGRGLTADVWGDETLYGECPCRECRELRIFS